MTTLRVNPLSYIRGRRLIFQHRRAIHALTLSRSVWGALRRFYDLPSLAPRVVDSGALDVDVEPLVTAGVLIRPETVGAFLRTERDVLVARHDPSLIYFALAATDTGLEWWFEHDGLGPVMCCARAGALRGSTRPMAIYLSYDIVTASASARAYSGRGVFVGEPRAVGALTTPKMGTHHLLETWGVKVPRQVTVPRIALRPGRSARRSVDQSVEYALRLEWGATEPRFPMFIKPGLGSGAHGATLVHNLPELVETAIRLDAVFAQPLVVEPFIRGHEWRVLVFASGDYAVTKRYPPVVHGNGADPVRVLIDAAHARRTARFARRGHLWRPRKPPISSPAVTGALHRQQLTVDSVPTPGRRVSLGRGHPQDINTSVDDTSSLSPKLLAKLLTIRESLGAPRLGFDLIGGSIGNGATPHVVEVNSRPFVIRHEEPDRGPSRAAALLTLQLFLDQGLSPRQIDTVADRCRDERAVGGR